MTEQVAEHLAAMNLCSSRQEDPLIQGDFYNRRYLVHEAIEGLPCVGAAAITVLLPSQHESAPSLQRRHLVGGNLRGTQALSTPAQLKTRESIFSKLMRQGIN